MLVRTAEANTSACRSTPQGLADSGGAMNYLESSNDQLGRPHKNTSWPDADTRTLRTSVTWWLFSAVATVAVALFASSMAHAQASSSGSGAVRTNPGFITNSVPRNDDGSTSRAIPIGFNINFFGQVFSDAWVNNNGNITFGGPLSTFTPEGLRASPLRIIAPFWADVDTRGPGSALVTYGTDTVNGHAAFGVNWVDVGYFASHDDKLNSFQLVLIDRADLGPGNFDIEFNYNRILWETGDASGGSAGFGGVPASAGYSNGTGKPEGSFEILGSRQRGLFLDSSRFGLVKRTLNSNVRGRLVFFVRNGSVDCTFSILSIDEPFPWQGGTGTVQVAAPGDCAWTAVSNSSFITIVGEANRTGSADVQYVVAENRRSARAGTLTVAGEVVRVLQDGFITLSVTPPAISVSAVDGRIPSQVALRVEAVRDPVNYVASVEIIDGSSNWRLSLNPSSGSVTATEPDIIFLDVSPGFGPLVAGLAEITVTDVDFGLSVKIPVVLGASQLGPRVEVSQSSFVFNAVQGSAAPPSQTLLVLNSGSGSLNWNVQSQAFAGAPWLRLSSTSGTAVAGSPLPTTTTLSVDQTGLAPGLYQTSLPINSPQALNNPQTITITLNLAAPDAASAAELTPRGMIFLAQQGLRQPQPQTLSISNRGAGPLSFGLQATTESGANWLVLSHTAGVASTEPSQVQVGVNTSRLGAGLHRGTITATFSTGEVQYVDVVLALSAGAGQLFPGSSSCNRQQIAMVTTTLGYGETIYSGLTQPIVTRLVDNCGNPVNDATVFVDAGPDTIVLQALGNGNYGGSWTPRSPAPAMTLLFTAFVGSSILQNSYTIVVYLAPGEPSLPVIDISGIVEGAGLAAGWPLAPGGIISILGAGLANADAAATTVPLPTELGGVRLQIGDQDAPLISVRSDLIRAQVPFNLQPGDSVSVRVINNGRVSAPQTMLVFPARPGILETEGVVIALDGNGSAISFQNPARPGGALQIRALGLGVTDPLPASGAPAPPASAVINPVQVFIGGVEVPVLGAGLVPGLVGIYEVGVLLPNNIPTGPDVPVVLRQAGITSDSSSNVGIPIVRVE
jgi:uncharacterized protein (TIGR03437 family)